MGSLLFPCFKMGLWPSHPGSKQQDEGKEGGEEGNKGGSEEGKRKKNVSN